VVKTGSAFISNGFGRFMNANANGEMTCGKLHSLEEGRRYRGGNA